jgi:Fanconi anemia group M protein
MFDNPLIRREALEEREYQLKIAEEAARQNLLVIMPTALGKTAVAVLAASYFLHNQPDKKVLVMAPSKPLVAQHRDTFLKFLVLPPEQTEMMTGEQPPESRTWADPQKRLYFATPQVVENDLRRGLSLGMFSFIVFDECQRARLRYAYSKIAEVASASEPCPIFLGLTASPGASTERIQQICDALRIEHIEVRTEEDPDVAPYMAPISMATKGVQIPPEYAPARALLRRMLDNRLSWLSENGIIKKDPRWIFKRDLLEAGDNLRRAIAQNPEGRLFRAAVVQAQAMALAHAIDLLETQGSQTLGEYVLQTIEKSEKRSHKTLRGSPEWPRLLDQLKSIQGTEHTKVPALKEILQEQFRGKPDARAIVFTQYRATASVLEQAARAWGYRAEKLIGQTAKRSGEGLSQAEQVELLNRLRDGDLQLIVATSIGEEGLDIPSVDLVVFYEPVPSEIRYIQRRGRTGRKHPGKAVILVAEGSSDEASARASLKRTERMKSIATRLNVKLRQEVLQ